jgi:phage protein D
MGLKYLPDYRIKANSADITALIRARLISLRYTDEAGAASDMLEIVLADHDDARPLAMPRVGAILSLSIGYKNALRKIGDFTVDEIERSGYPCSLTIRARAAGFDKGDNGAGNFKTQRTRGWVAGMTIGGVVAKIAQEHGLKPRVASNLAGEVLPQIDQKFESDLNFLLRVLKKYGAIAKPTNGFLVVSRTGTLKSISGLALPPVTLKPADVASFRMVQSKRETAGQVVAFWHSVEKAKQMQESVGEGEPVTRLPTDYPTQALALAAARAELERKQRGGATVSLTMAGRADVMAEGALILSGFRDGVNGSWSITRAEHAINNGGYVTTVEAEIPTDTSNEKTKESGDEDAESD